MLSNSPTKNQRPSGRLFLISLGPGDLQQMTIEAQSALKAADVVIGYQVYVDLIRPLLTPDQEVIASPIGQEMERAEQATDLAASGRQAAVISSGDIGIYAMASPVFEMLRQRGWEGSEPDVEVLPGVSAIQAAAARLGAPLGHDFCTISLSDLLTPWPVIERRLQAAAWGDFVIGFYNPRSQKRDWQLQRAIEILLAYRLESSPVAIVRNVTRSDEKVSLTTLADLKPEQVDMFTLVVVGNSQSYRLGDRIVTPRGYVTKAVAEEAASDQTSEAEALETGESEAFQADIYPITLTQMRGIQAVVIGGGPVGQRKIRGLLNGQAKVRLISPDATLTLKSWAEAGTIEWLQRPYQAGDVAGAEIVFAATNQRAVNAQVAQEARKSGLLCNVADQPGDGNFHVPAVHRHQDLVVAVNTMGRNPKRARTVRDRIKEWLDKEKI